jgi:AAA domain
MQTINKTGKLIQHRPHLSDRSEPQVCVGNDYSEDDLWFDLARLTLGDGGVLVVGLYSSDTRHQVIQERLKQSGDVDLTRVVYPHIDPIVRKITVQAREAYRGGLENIETGEVAWHDVAAQPAGLVTKTFNKRFHLGSRRNLQILTTAVKERATVASILHSYSDSAETGGCPINAVLIMEPNIDEGDLNYLQEFRAACPGVDVYIFHRWDEAKYGVEVTGDVDNWETEFPSLADVKQETQEVIVENMLIKGNVHVVSGPPEAFKTMGLIEFSSAVLDQRPVFDLLKVNRRYPILFLCADMSPVQLDVWAAPFNLRKHASDFRVMKGNAGIPNISDSVLQKAVQGRILILDTMLDFAKIQKAFESGEWNMFMQQLRELITVHGCIAVLMTAHATRAEVKSDSDNINAAQYFKDSVTFHGKVDIGFGCKVLKDTSLVKWERIKGRGFKYNKFSFTVAVHDEAGNSNLDSGRFPVFTPPEGMKQLAEKRKVLNGRKPNSDKQQKIEFAKSVDGSWQDKADGINKKFGSDHDKSTIRKWCLEFDEDQTA